MKRNFQNLATPIFVMGLLHARSVCISVNNNHVLSSVVDGTARPQPHAGITSSPRYSVTTGAPTPPFMHSLCVFTLDLSLQLCILPKVGKSPDC